MRFTYLLMVVITIVGIAVYKDSQQRQFVGFKGEEHEEELTTSIPSDVLAYVKEQEDVLGSQEPGIKPLPRSVRVPILMYHYIEYVKDAGDTIRKSLNTTPYTLEQEIKTLVDAGYTFLTNAELATILDGKRSLPAKPIVLTFDDGYRDFYTDAYPILKKYSVKATQYVVSGFLDRANYMFISQLKEIADDGLVEIGAHTVRHPALAALPIKIVEEELTKSKKTLENIIHKPVTSFAYPYGSFNVNVLGAVHKAGFTSATSTIPGIDQPQTHRYFLYRLRPGGRTGQSLLTWLATVKN